MSHEPMLATVCPTPGEIHHVGRKRQVGPGDFQGTERSIMPCGVDTVPGDASAQEKTSAFHDTPSQQHRKK